MDKFDFPKSREANKTLEKLQDDLQLCVTGALVHAAQEPIGPEKLQELVKNVKGMIGESMGRAFVAGSLAGMEFMSGL